MVSPGKIDDPIIQFCITGFNCLKIIENRAEAYLAYLLHPLVKAMQQQEMIESQKTTIESQQKRIEQLEQQRAAIEQQQETISELLAKVKKLEKEIKLNNRMAMSDAQ